MRVCVFAPIPYFFLHQRPQKLTDQLRSMSVDVTYIEPSGIREYLSGMRPGLLRGLGESVQRHLQAVFGLPFDSSGSGRADPVSADFSPVVMPVVIPHNRFDSRLLEKLNASVYRRALVERVLRKMKSNEPNIALVENPFWGAVLEKDDF